MSDDNKNTKDEEIKERIRDEDFKALCKQRESLDKARIQMSNVFDKYLLTFSTGGLFLSVSFTNTIIGNEINQKNLLSIGWIFLIVSIISVLFSFNFSEYAHERHIQIVDALIKTKRKKNSEEGVNIIVNMENCWKKPLFIFRWLAIFAFISGIIILSRFYFLNIK
ncbi:MAG: hypothetical protein WC831_01670 [Parcubacteria group bacterium]|jgi:Na+/melibiose symporter-like transporter